MDLTEILSLIEDDLKLVEENITANLDNKIKLIPTIGKHILGSGGKRLRPSLLLLTCKLFDYNGEERIYLSSSLEYIHTATLLHDDVVDNSNLRRGKKSANSIWGNEASVLIGDFLFAKAFILMVKCNNIKILDILSNATGELAEGEIFELVKTGDLDTAYEEYFEIISKKTAVLFSAACEIGGVLAQRNRKEIEEIKNYGKNIGIAFQLVDDALDYISTDEEFGKKIGIDIEEGKVTLPLITAIKNCSSKKAYSEVKEIFYKDNIEKSDIDFLKNFVLNNKGIDNTFNVAQNYIENAKKNIVSFNDNPAKQALLKLADFISKRRF